MRSTLATVLEVAGGLAVTVGALIANTAAGLVVGGALAIGYGYLLERD